MTVLLVITALILVGTARAHTPPAHVKREVCRLFKTRCGAALRVSWCESRWYPRAIGGGNVGIFQINYAAHHYSGESWSMFVRRFIDLRRNVAFAYRLSSGGRDWSAWTCQP